MDWNKLKWTKSELEWTEMNQNEVKQGMLQEIKWNLMII